MDLNGPGISLFQGTDLDGFNNHARQEEEEEEEEALEEQRRRDLELKSILEGAFEDVSFENDEESLCNGSANHSNVNHSLQYNNSNSEFDCNHFKSSSENRVLLDLEQNSSRNIIDQMNTSVKQEKNLVKRVDLSSDSINYTDQCRKKKVQNGNLHDVVDASGGGRNIGSSHYNHCFQKSPSSDSSLNGLNNVNGSKTNFCEEAQDSSEQLKILYDVRVREVHRLTELIDCMKKEHEMRLNKITYELALAQAENERSNISQKQLQSLLVTNKQELENQESQIAELQKKNNELELCNKELMHQLETNKLVINDLERKVTVLERGSRSISDVQYQMNIQALNEKHSFELMNLNLERDKLLKTNENLDKENIELKLKLSELSQINDENIAKKTEIINRLSKEIEEVQKHHENLLKSSSVEDSIRLQMEVKILKDEKSALVSKLDALEKENIRQEDELKQYESLNKITSYCTFADSSKDFDGSEVSGKLGEELFRALNGQKAKRQEIKNLQATLNEKNEKITCLMENQKLSELEMTQLKEEMKQCSERIKNHDKLMQHKDSEIAKLHKCVEDLKQEKENAESDFRNKNLEQENEITYLKEKISKLNEENQSNTTFPEEYTRFHNEALERARAETKKYFDIELLKKDLENENLKKEIEEIKNLYVEVFSAKESLLKQLEKEKNSPSKGSLVSVEEVKRLQKELEKSRHRILELDETLKQQYEQEVEILNLDINQLKLQIEKMKKEKDRALNERDKIGIENELLKTEIEQITSEKNLLFLEFEKSQKEIEEVCTNIQKLKESSEKALKDERQQFESELLAITNKYEATIKKLKKEIELTLVKSVKCESKFTSPLKCVTRSVESQYSPKGSPNRKQTSPKDKAQTANACTSPVSKTRNVATFTEPEPNKISRKEVVDIMEKLGAHHENEMKMLEHKYRIELSRLDKRFEVEVDRAKALIRKELEKAHALEIEQMEEKHKIELENRIEQEKKDAVADLITEWACEVQSLKASYAEANTEMERMKMKYKAAKSMALQYKTYFKSKTEHMREEWKRIEDGYEQALRELEKNVHILVDVKEDEVKAKVDSITKIYEQKISKMKEKLLKCEDKLRAKRESESRKVKAPGSTDGYEFNRELLEKLNVPTETLCLNPWTKEKKISRGVESSSKGKGNGEELFGKEREI